MKTHLISAAQACQATRPLSVTELLALALVFIFFGFIMFGLYKLILAI